MYPLLKGQGNLLNKIVWTERKNKNIRTGQYIRVGINMIYCIQKYDTKA